MKLRTLTVENFRRFREPFTLSGLTDGLNFICEPNEVGKSTLLEAMRAALFVRHRSSAADDYRPYGERTSPKVSLEFDLPDGRWHLEKKFMPGAAVSLVGPDGVRHQSDEAEAKLQVLLGFDHGRSSAGPNESGVLGLLWVEQAAGFSPGAPGDRARRTIETLLAQEVGAVTGGKRAQSVRTSVESALRRYYNTNGSPRDQLLQAHTRTADAKAAVLSAETEFARLEGVLARLERERGELGRLQAEIDDPEVQTAIDRWASAKARAALASAHLTAAQAIARAAQQRKQRASEVLATRRADITKAELTTKQAADAASKASESDASVSLVRTRFLVAEQILTDAGVARSAAEQVEQDTATLAATSRRKQAIVAAFARLDGANILLQRQRDFEAAIAKNAVDGKRLAAIEATELHLVTSRAALEASATRIRFDLTDLGRTLVKLDGADISEREILLQGTTVLGLGNLGNIAIIPPAESAAAASGSVRLAELARDRLLGQLGVSDLAAARLKARTRETQGRDVVALKAELERACPADESLTIPAGLAALAHYLVSETRPAATTTELRLNEQSLVDARVVSAEARNVERLAQESLNKANLALTNAEKTNVELNIKAKRAIEDAKTAGAIVTQAEAETSMNDLEDTLASCGVDLDTAQSAEQSAIQGMDGLDVELIAKRLSTAERVKVALGERIQALRLSLAGLAVEAQTLGGAGPASALQHAREKLEAAEADATRVLEEGETLKLLKAVLDEASAEASRRYLEPVTRRVNPYVRRLLPGADLRFGEGLAAETLTRSGRAEPTANLSRGTQEQLAVLTRLGFAELLAERGTPASVVLDDSLVFSDDDRLELMLEIVADAAKHTQIIVLSCRSRAFRSIDANVIKISAI